MLQFLKRLQESRIHTALDTTGHIPYDIIKESLPHTDLYLYDLKNFDNGMHQKATGVPNTLILENAVKIAGDGGKIQIRIPIIPDFNDSEKNIREAGLFRQSLGNAVTVLQLLPYHNLGVMKYTRIDNRNVAFEATPPSETKIEKIRIILEGLDLPVTVY